MTGSVRIRSGTVADAPAVLELWRVAGAQPSVSDDVDSIERLLRIDPEALAVAEVDGVVSGTLITAFDGWRAGFYRLAVDPRARRLGIALALVRAGEERLRALGARRVQAIVVESHADAVGFWLAAGYLRHDGVGRFTRDLHLDVGEDGGQTAEC